MKLRRFSNDEFSSFWLDTLSRIFAERRAYNPKNEIEKKSRQNSHTRFAFYTDDKLIYLKFSLWQSPISVRGTEYKE